MIKNINKKKSLFLKALKKDKDLKHYKRGIKAIKNLPLNSFKNLINILNNWKGGKKIWLNQKLKHLKLISYAEDL